VSRIENFIGLPSEKKNSALLFGYYPMSHFSLKKTLPPFWSKIPTQLGHINRDSFFFGGFLPEDGDNPVSETLFEIKLGLWIVSKISTIILISRRHEFYILFR
jgi:hypothetical protein